MSISPATFNFVDDKDNPLKRDRIVVGATFYRRLIGYDLATPGGVITPAIDYGTLDRLDLTWAVGLRSYLRASRFATGDPIAIAEAVLVGDPADCEIDYTIDSVQTALMQTKPRSGWMDIEAYDLADPPRVERILQGRWDSDAEVTRP